MRETVKMNGFLEHFTMSKIEFSPNGQHTAFLLSKPNLEANKSDANLWIVDNKTRCIKKLTSLSDAKKPFFLNDNEIAFEGGKARAGEKPKSDSEDKTRFYKIPIDGGEAEFFMEIPLAVKEIEKLSCDCGCYLVTAIYDNAKKDDEKCDEKKEDKKKEKNHVIFDEIPFWSNESGITNKKRERLYIYNPKDGTAEPISEPFQRVNDFAAVDGGVIFTANYFTDVFVPKAGVYFYDFATKKTETLLDDGAYSVSFVGKFNGDVIFAGTDGKTYGSSENHHFYKLKDKQASLMFKLDSRVSSITVKPDGIYYIGYDFGMDAILFKLDGAWQRHKVCHIEGFVDDFDVCGESIVCRARKKAGLQELYFVKNGELEDVTQFNADYLAKVNVSIPEKLSVKSDDVMVEGYVLKPHNYDPSKTYPGILMIHGGPKSVSGCAYMHNQQFYAANGYFVFMCNPRGSDGYGDEFSDIRGKYGMIDYDDIMRFTDAVLQTYTQIDANRVGVAGHSYGGYMTSWIIGQTDRFKCAVSSGTISNLTTKVLTTDIGYYHNMPQQLATPWDNYEKIWWHSPLKYADKVKTPTLFIEGEKDYRTWIVEGIQMFTALKMHGVDSRMCLIYGANHGQSSKPENAITVLTEALGWFEKYLK